MCDYIKFDLTPEEEKYLLKELSDFFRGFIFFNAENMGKPVIEKLRAQALYAGDEIIVTYTIGVDRNLIIAMLAKILPYPKKLDKKMLVDKGLERKAAKILGLKGVI